MKRKLKDWGFIFVDVAIEDKTGNLKQQTMLFDTGCAMTEISHLTAEKLGYSPKDGQRAASITSPAGKIPGYTMHVPKISIFNGKIIRNLEVDVFDLTHVQNSDDEFDGILGMDIIRQFDITIEGASGRVAAKK